ncbi:hypothetical protein D1007_62311 [Hordeum vulgare]|nr:hypothetical protein D1007_62311 [Hordeum vulgare]
MRSRISSIKPPPQKQQLSGIKISVLSAGDRIGRAVGRVFFHLRIDDGLDIAYVRLYRRIFYRGCPTASADEAECKQDTVASPDLILHVRDLIQYIRFREFDQRSKFPVLNLEGLLSKVAKNLLKKGVCRP